MNARKIRYIKFLMLLINILAVAFPTVCIYITTNRICDFYIAREFIGKVATIPSRPHMILCLTILLLGCLLISFLFREYLFGESNLLKYGSLAFDFILCMTVMVIQHFNYNGILFWVFANIIYYVRDKVKILFMLLAMGIYVGTNYEVLSIQSSLFRFSDYVDYYGTTTQQYLLGIYNILVSLNSIVFILFCIYVIQEQQGVIEQVNSLYAKLTKTNTELQLANEELKQYAVMKEKMGETKERNRLAREIHDTLGHTLTGISAGIDACLTTIEMNPMATKKQLEVISKVTREGIGEVRRSVNQLRPDALERLSLDSALQTMIEDMQSVTKADIQLEYNLGSFRFREDEETTIYRIVQESITNSLRHGKADKIQITIGKRESYIDIEIQDNGIGCQEIKEGFGIRHMQERIQMLHGKVSFKGNKGFLVKAIIPVRWGEEYDESLNCR
ncbi:two-component sensor histidine kinase [Sporanaerobium hydrogeniformans]|uniref:Two-component sensor histidine kinase n=1 Tax=Sporanaerobium hydrogeniformans TaxID=3072179 RepID=A0AC61DB11_9FIRM|nr:sensor histidine kinase [Sporanaerobium hydrogeniformans]PHV70055.1 two-component sensor histidine kinase [Sporanaerobium hydrogeniformans]